MGGPPSPRLSDLLLVQLLTALGEHLRELLLGVGIEVGHLNQLADFDHFSVRAWDARGPFDRLFARLHLNNPKAAYDFLRFGEWTVSDFRLFALERDACAHRGRVHAVEREQ